MDNILSAEAARKKGIDSPVPGHADIILAPSIEVANTFSKTLNYLMHSSNAGIVMGAAAPIILPSRASDPASKYASLAMGVLLAKYKFRLTLAAGEIPMLKLKLKPGADVLETALELVEDLKLAGQPAK